MISFLPTGYICEGNEQSIARRVFTTQTKVCQFSREIWGPPRRGKTFHAACRKEHRMKSPMITETFPDDPAFAAQGANAAGRHPGDDAVCWLWWDGAIPSLPGERLGVIGHYRAETAEAGQAVLND